MKKILTIIIAFFSIIADVCFAQSQQYKFLHVTIDNGLSHNQISSIYKDSKGFMWFGTISGLNRYDGYQITQYAHNPEVDNSLIDNFVQNIMEDHTGKLWIATRSGYCIYDPQTEAFIRDVAGYCKRLDLPDSAVNIIKRDNSGNVWYVFPSAGVYVHDVKEKKMHRVKATSIKQTNISVSDLNFDSIGNAWIIFSNGLISGIDSQQQAINGSNEYLKNTTKDVAGTFRLFIDSDADMWVYIANAPGGVYYKKKDENKFVQFNVNSKPVTLNNNIVTGIVEDNNKNIWIGTDHGGINLINKKNFSVSWVKSDEEDKKSLGQNSITSLYKDNSAIIWVGTFKKGVSFYHENIIKFSHYKHQIANPHSLSFDDVNCFAEDVKGNIWIGTNGGGLIYFDREKQTFRQYRHDPKDNNSLSNDVIVSLFIDHEQILWIGTYYGGLNRFDGNKFTTWMHREGDKTSLIDDKVWEIFEDSQQNLWVGTLGGGLDLFDREKQAFYHYKSGETNSIRSDFIMSIIEDKAKNLWIGTVTGIELLNRETGRFTNFSKGNPQLPVSDNNIIILLEDSRNWIWIGTRDGLNVYDPATKAFRVITKEDGLADKAALTLLEDANKNIWTGTPGGLSNIILNNSDLKNLSFTIRNYDESDGLQGKEFNENASLKTQRGELIFGGANGFNIFKPDEFQTNNIIPNIVFTDFQVFNRSISAGKEVFGRKILESSITSTNEIVLKHNEKIFSIEFAALNYFHPQKNQYKYKLEGFSKDWLDADPGVRKATFTNLDPGDYVLHVIASNNDGIWNSDGASIKIKVLPPFWKTPVAFVIYVIFVFGILFLSRRLILQRERMKYKMEHERQEAERMHVLDMMKIRFFTNISHEFRTPLSLIITPVEKLISSTNDEGQKQQFTMIHRNAKRLLNLVNQLLDFRRLEVQEVKLNPVKSDIISFVKDISYSFSDISEKKNISFVFKTDIQALETYFDADKLERVLFNLLSNAFKFTPVGGKVKVKIRYNAADADEQKRLQIGVSDTGIGIPEDKLEKIFERFFQNDTPVNMINQGSGIGLSITRDFVKLHGGQIKVESEVGRGSKFIIFLPVTLDSAVKETPTNEQEHQIQSYEPIRESKVPPNNYSATSDLKPLVLLVEDNDDFRFYLKDNLRSFYTIMEAENGKTGWKMALKFNPDLIVSDVMMPEMNGFDLCRKLKADTRTSKIPVILLTAHASDDQKLQGFETGADDYLTKPFNFELLLSRIRNIISQRESLIKSLENHVKIKTTEVEITSVDEKLINTAVEIVENNISNADFSVEELSRELGMSRVKLYKKLLSLTGKTPIEFIRTIRLQRAAKLLEKSQLSVAEVAYQVGFNNPKYFAKYFKDEFNLLPSVYMAEKQSK